MNLSVFLQHRFMGTPDGCVWTKTIFGYPFWERYLDVFDQVNVVARVQDVHQRLSEWVPANGNQVSFVRLPFYIGPEQYLRNLGQVRRLTKETLHNNPAVIFRVDPQVALFAEPLLISTKRPYGLEVVTDPYDVFSPGAIKNIFRPIYRLMFTSLLRTQCARASAVAYVTKQSLQQRYPCPNYSIAVSDVEIDDCDQVTKPRQFLPVKYPLRLIAVGTMEQLYKAPDILIKAFSLCVNRGLDLELIMVGDGKYKSQLQAQVNSLGLGQRVNFVGQLPAGKPVRVQLDQADLFILPSRQEGLPRAMIEAMARALPCIGSTIGGIPELLHPEEMVQPNDVEALADKIEAIIKDPKRMAEMSARNLDKSNEYKNSLLRQQRIAFLHKIRELSTEWQVVQKN